MESQIPVKKFINNKEKVVDEALEGLCLSNTKIVRIKGTQIITLAKLPVDQVALICGGGSGHEPAHAGFVDEKVLTAAVCGGVFASPPTKEISIAIQHVQNKHGVLIIIKNYTGDVINFELSAELCRGKGIQIETLLVADDIAFLQDKNDIQGKKSARGLTGTVLIYKILGALSFFKQMELSQLKTFGEKLLDNIFTLGVSLTPCSIPGYPHTFQLGADEMEIGLGIHGEKGKGRAKLVGADEIIEQILKKFDSFVNSNQEVVLILNNLGSCTDLEMSILMRGLINSLRVRKITVLRIIQGRIMTSLEMQGILITLFTVNPDYKDTVLKCIDLEIDNKNWVVSQVNQNLYTENRFVNDFITQIKLSPQPKCEIKKIFTTVLTKLKEQDLYFNKLDSEVGDGDTGSGLARACQKVLEQIDNIPLSQDFSNSLQFIGELLSLGFGGTSGPLYGMLFSCAAKKLKAHFEENTVLQFSQALEQGVYGIKQLGKAQIGERTMVDVIEPVQHTLSNIASNQNNFTTQEILAQLLEKAKQTALAASKLKATKGRSRYLNGQEIGKRDPGCELVVAWLQILFEYFQKK